MGIPTANLHPIPQFTPVTLNAGFAGRRGSRISAHPPFRPYNNPIHRHTGTLSAAEMMAQLA
jgi:hypothetical protein